MLNKFLLILCNVVFLASVSMAADRTYINATGDAIKITIRPEGSNKVIESNWLKDGETWRVSLTHNATYHFRVRHKDGTTAELGKKKAMDPNPQKMAFVRKTRVVNKQYVRPDGTIVTATPIEHYTDLEPRK